MWSLENERKELGRPRHVPLAWLYPAGDFVPEISFQFQERGVKGGEPAAEDSASFLSDSFWPLSL